MDDPIRFLSPPIQLGMKLVSRFGLRGASSHLRSSSVESTQRPSRARLEWCRSVNFAAKHPARLSGSDGMGDPLDGAESSVGESAG
jgi:hypothetical protein